jgi:hypothetical protein
MYFMYGNDDDDDEENTKFVVENRMCVQYQRRIYNIAC